MGKIKISVLLMKELFVEKSKYKPWPYSSTQINNSDNIHKKFRNKIYLYLTVRFRATAGALVSQVKKGGTGASLQFTAIISFDSRCQSFTAQWCISPI